MESKVESEINDTTSKYELTWKWLLMALSFLIFWWEKRRAHFSNYGKILESSPSGAIKIGGESSCVRKNSRVSIPREYTYARPTRSVCLLLLPCKLTPRNILFLVLIWRFALHYLTLQESISRESELCEVKTTTSVVCFKVDICLSLQIIGSRL